MAEQHLPPKKSHSDDWQIVEIGPSARVHSKPVDETILKRMPVSTRTFLDVGIWDLVKMKLKEVFSPASRSDRP
jgi:hypothetical protein